MEWYAEAIRLDGPANKFGGYAAGDYADKRGEVKHSMAGSFDGAMGVLSGPAQSSWHFSVCKDGRVYQHYPLSANTWHGNDSDDDDNVAANIDLVGVEHEGGGPGNESEPLTYAQLDATTRLTGWMMAQFGFSACARLGSTSATVWLLVEHNEVGNTATACPSGRIPWAEIQTRLAVPAPAPDHDTTLDVRPGYNGIETVGVYQILYVGGVPIWRYGGVSAGASAKNFGGAWVYLRNDGATRAWWSTEAGD
jgi:hypothetical protein